MYVGKRISPAVVSLGNTTAWECREKPPFVTRVASRAHPLAECRGAATEAARSAGKGRFGGNVETRISPAVVSPGNTTAWGRRKKTSLCHPCRQPSAPACGMPRRRNGSRAQRRQREVWRECRNEDFSGCYFARKYNCMGTPKKKPPFVKGRFGGNVETRMSPAVTSLGNTTAWGRRRNPTARGSCSPRSGGKAP